MLTKRGTVMLSGVVQTGALGILLVGCVDTAQVDARHAPVPVTVGPVSCMGCKPDSVDVGAAGQIKDKAYDYAIWSPFSDSHTERERETQLGLQVALAVSDLCRDEIQVESIKAMAFDMFYVVYGKYGVKVVTKAGKTESSDGTCQPESWPFSGPNGLVYLAADGDDAAEGKPAPAPEASSEPSQPPKDIPSPATPSEAEPAEASGPPSAEASPGPAPAPQTDSTEDTE